MKFTEYSKNRLLNTFALYEVPKDFADPLYNYLVHGFHPGSFWYFVLVNDFAKAILSSHPSNTVPALKKTVSWLTNTLPDSVWGTPKTVEAWLELPTDKRRATLEELRLIYTEREEVILVLKGAPTVEPILW